MALKNKTITLCFCPRSNCAKVNMLEDGTCEMEVLDCATIPGRLKYRKAKK
jgi:hypothetical protein